MIGHIIGMLIVGLIVGAVARLLTPGRDPMGCLATALLGIAGSFVGGFIGNAIWPSRGNVRPGLILSVVGAIILLLIWRAIRGSRN
ncbi:MAG TPA: GlsB/YeaQ/YmgE family stress response membrane protein [Blastocatellia bacterium]|nr:GlsB/YeaQ/YmgE family stress response membrane protein [Blastocatellia bacterium]